MCKKRRTAKNPAFRRRRIINRMDSVTVCTIGVNSNLISKIKVYIIIEKDELNGGGRNEVYLDA
ncbi:MAG: hypothetical protein HDT30_05640 [Clostridiales bacterium]|nr:hypothetical protein [Clostridiales bacterium]